MQTLDQIRDQVMTSLNQPGDRLYALLDAARDRGVPELLDELGIERLPLYHRSPIPPALLAALPYLAPCEPSSELFARIVSERWGDAWGIWAVSSSGLERVRRHLRQQLEVEVPSGERMILRFYDPRVLPTFLPSCDEEQSAAFFGPVRRFLCEGPAGEVLAFDPS